MNKKRIIFYTDCFILGGCEKPIYEIISSTDFTNKYDFLLVFRFSKKYIKDIEMLFPELLKQPEKLRKVCFPDITTFNIFLEGRVSNFLILNVVKNIIFLFFMIFSPVFFIYEFIVLYKVFLFECADIIHINNGGYPGALSCRAAVLAAVAAKKTKIIMNVNNTTYRNKNIFNYFLDSFINRAINYFITGSKASAVQLYDKRGFNKNKIKNIYYGIREAVLERQNIENFKFITMVARFEERKGHKYVLLAFKSLIERWPEYKDLKLILLGEGPLFERMKKLSKDSNLENNVIFLGHREDCINFVSSGLFTINPSLYNEDLPHTIIEAMSVGVPAIGTDIAGIPEEITDRSTGLIVEPADVDGLTLAMFSLLNNEEKRINMGMAAKKKFLDYFTVKGMVNNYINLYDSLLKN